MLALRISEVDFPFVILTRLDWTELIERLESLPDFPVTPSRSFCLSSLSSFFLYFMAYISDMQFTTNTLINLSSFSAMLRCYLTSLAPYAVAEAPYPVGEEPIILEVDFLFLVG